MTDLEKFLDLYKSVGVNPEIYTYEEATVVTLFADITNKTEGYMDFYTEINFDKDGKFVYQGIYE